MIHYIRFRALQIILVATLAAASPGIIAAENFDSQRQAMAASLETQSEAAVLELLKAGIAEGKPSQAISITQKWMRQNRPENDELVYYAARAAELSGDLVAAVSLYQQYLQQADPQATNVGKALVAMCVLQSSHLRDPGPAFVFCSRHGHRLVSNPAARQMDRWFLDLAYEREDFHAITKRLLALIQAGVPNAEMTALYADDFYRLHQFVMEEPNVGIPSTAYADVEKLAKAITFDDDLSLQLAAFAGVHRYYIDSHRKKNPEAPLAATEALLKRNPSYASALLNTWMGGNHSRNTTWKASWDKNSSQAKIAQITAAEARMTPLQRAEFLQTRSPGRYGSRKPNPFSTGGIKAHAKAHPEVVNIRSAWHWQGSDWRFDRDDYKNYAPLVAKTPTRQASEFRTRAAANDFDEAIELASGSEAWCLPLDEKALIQYVEHLWHVYGKPGGDAKKKSAIAKLKAVRAKAKWYNAKHPVAERMQRFDILWADFNSDKPTIPAVREQLVRLIRVSPEAIPALLKDSSVTAQLMAKDLIDAGIDGPDGPLSGEGKVRGLRTDIYDPSIRIKQRQLGRHLRAKRAHGLEPILRQVVADRLAKGEITPWLTLAWINAQYYRDNVEQHALAQKLVAAPAFAKQPYLVRYALRDWFGNSVMTPAERTARAKVGYPFHPIRNLPENADLATVEKAMAESLKSMANTQTLHYFHDKGYLSRAKEGVLGNVELQPYFAELADPMIFGSSQTNLGEWFVTLRDQRDPATIHRAANLVWLYAKQHNRGQYHGQVMGFVESLLNDHPSAASALARHGQRQIAYNKETDLPRLKAVVGKAAVKMGLVVIPVPPEHAAYPVYRSQGDWLVGNEDSAWELIDNNWSQLLPNHRKLSANYLNWLLQRVIDNRNEARQQELLTALFAWAKERTSPLSADDKINLELAHGDIAIQRGRLDQALAIFSRTASNKAYEGRILRHQANLRKVLVQRLARNFDGALETLSELAFARVPELQVPIRFAKAETYYDMEDYDSADEEIQGVLARQPNHPQAIILEGRVRLQRMELMEATELEIGSTSEVERLVPGESLKVTLSDPTLSVAGAGAEIEVEVWTTTGDKEVTMLRRFGDNKSKFRGEIKTALGRAIPGDKTLQVIGDDKVYYDYSESFRKRLGNLEENRGGPIIIASDGLLIASARELLSAEEQRAADATARMARMARHGQKAKKEDVVADAEIAAQTALASRIDSQLSGGGVEMDAKKVAQSITVTSSNRVKPGNTIHLRVVDPDRSRTAAIDELTVNLRSSSGDSINRVVLKEVDTHSGWFEGKVKTAPNQATATASSSETGRNPNTVISPLTDRQEWRPAPSEKAPYLTVDLGDDELVQTLKIRAENTSAPVPAFVLHTGNRQNLLTPTASYPHNVGLAKSPYQPSVMLVTDDRPRSITDARDFLEASWLLSSKYSSHSQTLAKASQALSKDVVGKWQSGRHNPPTVYRFKAYFHESARTVTRRFALKLGAFKYKAPNRHVRGDANFLMAVNGRPIAQGDKLDGTVKLTRGVHVLEVWATGWGQAIGFGRSFRLQANLEDPNKLVDCPDAFFDPANMPLPDGNTPATVTANKSKTEYTVTFAPGTRTRFLRLVTPNPKESAPGISKLVLTGTDDRQLLPVANDFAELNKNQTLEIQANDQISIRYLDDRPASPKNTRHERLLYVGYTDGEISLEREFQRSSAAGNVYTEFRTLLRFPIGEPITGIVNDADMDVTNQPDSVKVTITTAAGDEKQFTARESGKATGIFRFTFTPVAGKAGDGQVRVREGGSITATYLDEETTHSRTSVKRTIVIPHARYEEPVVQFSHATVTALDKDQAGGTHPLVEGFKRLTKDQIAKETEIQRRSRLRAVGQIKPRWQVSNDLRPIDAPPEGGFAFVHGQTAFFQIKAPQQALYAGSSVIVYAQTESGRRLAGISDDAPFSIKVPGTIRVRAGLLYGQRRLPEESKGVQFPAYLTHNKYFWRSNKQADQIFAARVPLTSGFLPEEGAMSDEEYAKVRFPEVESLVVKPGERIYFGYRFPGANGHKKWITVEGTTTTFPVLDVMHDDYRKARTSANVGESLYFRVVDLGGDRTDNPDVVNLFMQAKSGAKHHLELRETGSHTGVFKGVFDLSYKSSDAVEDEAYDVRQLGFPVVYGDKIGLRYTSPNGTKTPAYYLDILKGADGKITPFSKTYADEEIAMQTQFALAESHLELAKRHRQNGNADIAEHDYERAKQLLAKAMEQFRNPETRAKALYLLGNLTLEEAVGATDPAVAKTRYKAALSRYMEVTSTYPQTLIASQAQFRIASVYERMTEHDIAAQEYVKLAYKYPDSEYLALAMAKLGTYFNRNAKRYEYMAKQMLETDHENAETEAEATRRMAMLEYVKAGRIFARVQERFPNHPLAGKAGLRAGQAYFRAERYDDALDALLPVVKNKSYDGVEVRSQAMYWAGDSYTRTGQLMAAFSILKRLTYDFPESEWASYARAKLADSQLAGIEARLEIQRLENQR